MTVARCSICRDGSSGSVISASRVDRRDRCRHQCLDRLLPRRDHAAVERFVALIDEDAGIAITDVILTEILQGLRSEADVRRVERRLAPFEVLRLEELDDYRRATSLYRVRAARASRSAARSIASSHRCAFGRTLRCCTPTPTSTASRHAARFDSPERGPSVQCPAICPPSMCRISPVMYGDDSKNMTPATMSPTCPTWPSGWLPARSS